MANIFLDSYDHYTTVTDKGYTAVIPLQGGTAAPLAAEGRFSTSSLRISSGFSAPYAATTLDRSLGASYSTLIVGFAFRWNSSVDQDVRALSFYATSTEYFRFGVYRATGEIYIIRNGTTVNTGTIVTAGTYNFIELKITFHTSAGSWELRKNNASIMSQSSVNTGAAVNKFQWYAGQGDSFDVDDFYIHDTTGSDNNDFTGDSRVYAALASGAGTTTGLSVNTGTNYAAVDDAAPDGDTTYVYSKVVNTFDTYAFADISNATSVKALQFLAYAKKDDAGNRQLAFMTRTNSSNFTGADKVVPAGSYTYITETQEVNPDTTTAWTQSEINAAEFGVKVR